jgi:hypothetical protein
MKVAFVSGFELETLSLTGPGRIGPIVITPSMPLLVSDCVCPQEKQQGIATIIGMAQNIRGSICLKIGFTSFGSDQSFCADGSLENANRTIDKAVFVRLIRAVIFFPPVTLLRGAVPKAAVSVNVIFKQ